jgi:transcriptional regulator with XRE-family HTH domain
MSELPSFEGWVRQRRRLLDLTREELAGRVGCAAVSIRRIEIGERRPSKQLAGLLARALELGEEERAPFLLAARRELAVDGLPAPQAGLVEAHGAATNANLRSANVPSLAGLAGAILSRNHANLPAQLTPLIGREHEVADVCNLLRRGDVRLLTLTGPGGIGKTRLALGACEELLGAFVEGVLLVELTPLKTSTMVLPTIARVLGRSESSTPLFDDLAAYLRGKRMLLLLDNVEHLLEAAPAFARLLAAAPGLCILATSRATL